MKQAALALALALACAFVSIAARASEADCEATYLRSIDRAQFPDPVAGLHYFESMKQRCSEEDPRYWSHLAALNNVAGRPDVGEKIVTDGLAAHPSDRNLLLSQVYAFVRKKNFVGASADAQKLMKEQPDWYGGFMANQLVLLNTGKDAESLPFGEKAVALADGQVPLVFMNHAVANFRVGNMAACAEGVLTALAQDPSLSAEAWGTDEAIFALARLNRRQEAFDLAKHRIAADPNWRADPNMVRVAHLMGLDR